MQNEELKRAKLETEDALAKYSDLYDFAPIGLFFIDVQGLIQEVNLAGASLLGTERRNLMEDELCATQEHLDQKVQEMSAKLQKTMRELQVANEKAKNRDRSARMTERNC